MFTGIIETTGQIVAMVKSGSNMHFSIRSSISEELKVDQSVSHNGVCLTVTSTKLHEEGYWLHNVTAIDETLNRTNLGKWSPGDRVNLERCLPMGGRLDGHIVQGHVDTVAECIGVVMKDGSWEFAFRYQPTPEHILVDKGSVCLNGVSLTVVNPVADTFSVAIIPYTWEHTNFCKLEKGHSVNIEFDILGKYIAKYMSAYAANFR